MYLQNHTQHMKFGEDFSFDFEPLKTRSLAYAYFYLWRLTRGCERSRCKPGC